MGFAGCMLEGGGEGVCVCCVLGGHYAQIRDSGEKGPSFEALRVKTNWRKTDERVHERFMFVVSLAE